MANRLFRALPASLLLVSVSVSCGGTAFRGGDDNDSGGSSSTGSGASAGSGTGSTGSSGSGAASSGGHAGLAGSGGAPGAGATGAVGGTGTGATGATGGIGGKPSFCALPAEAGDCEAAIERFYFDASLGICRSFTYGGCGGNENNFPTLEECQSACGGDPFGECSDNDQCVLVASGCCDGCEPHDKSQFVAVNQVRAGAFQVWKGCGDVACAPCPAPALGASTRGYFIATCDTGQCQVVDLRETPVTACEVPQDCQLRLGSACCEACSGDGAAIAISDPGGLSALVCGPDLIGCPACEPSPSPNLMPTCLDGVCGVTTIYY